MIESLFVDHGRSLPYVPIVIGAVISAAVGFVTTLIMNRGHDRRLRIQLFNDDRKNEIAKLHQLVMEPSKDVWKWWWNISKYLDTFEAKAFLPSEEMAWARNLIRNVEEKMKKTYPEDAEIDEMEKQIEEEGKENWLETLDEEQLKDYDLQEYMAELKRNAGSDLVSAVSGLADPRGLHLNWRNGLRLPHFARFKFRNRKRKRKQST